MIDSTNPRILANNIRKLFAMVKAIVPGTVVEGNPIGSGYDNLLTKIKIGSSKYKLPEEVTANPEGEATGSITKLGVGSAIYEVGGSYTPPAYSTTEFDTGKKYLDRVVYGKFFDYTIASSGGTVTVATIPQDVDILLFFTVNALTSSRGVYFPGTSAEAASYLTFSSDSSKNINAYLGSSFTGDHICTYIEYVKAAAPAALTSSTRKKSTN